MQLLRTDNRNPRKQEEEEDMNPEIEFEDFNNDNNIFAIQ